MNSGLLSFILHTTPPQSLTQKFAPGYKIQVEIIFLLLSKIEREKNVKNSFLEQILKNFVKSKKGGEMENKNGSSNIIRNKGVGRNNKKLNINKIESSIFIYIVYTKTLYINIIY